MKFLPLRPFYSLVSNSPNFKILALRPGLWLLADFTIVRWSDSTSISAPTTEVDFPWPNRNWPVESDGSDQASAKYKSTFWYVGVNAKLRVSRWLSVFGGPRYYQLAENLDLRACDGEPCPLNGEPSAYAQYHVTTSNNLVGAEIGAMAKFRIIRRLQISLRGSVGAFGNFVSGNQFLQDNGNVARDEGKSKTSFSFVGAARLQLTFRVTHFIPLCAGYDMMYITGLATAPAQLDFSLTAAGPPPSSTSLRANDSIIIHGGLAGIKVHW